MTQVAYPTRPVREPLLGTLLDAATVLEQGSIGWLGTGENLWESFAELTFGNSPVFPCDVQPAKDLDQVATWVSGFRFGAYGGTTCKSVGQDMADFKAQVDAAFNAGESTAVETAFMGTRFAPDADDRWADPEDITPAGGAVKPIVGLALLEGYMARHYIGRPVLHLPTVIASLVSVADQVELEGKVLQTKLGSVVVNGAGYDEPNTGPDGDPAPDGEKWIYATGAVQVLRSPSILRQAMDRETNEVVTLAERIYIAAAEGPTVAVRVQVAS